MWHDMIRFGLVRIFYPCLMIFGTIGNILCLKILLRKRFRRKSTCQYLCILAVIDILFIYTRSTRYLYRYVYGSDLRNTSLWICRIFIYFSSTLSHLASWILVIVSFDRYFIMKNFFPRRHVTCRVLKSTCTLIIIVCTVNLHYFLILGTYMPIKIPIVSTNHEVSEETFYVINRFVCMARPAFEDFFRLYVPIFDILFVAIIPFCLMIFTNIGIIRTTMQSKMSCTTSRKQQRNNRLTVMLLSVILAFMLLTCPSVIYICLNRLTSSRIVSDRKSLILDLLEALWYTKHALNFILYTLSGQDFRREFMKLFSCCRRRTSNVLNNQQRNQNNGLPTNAGVFSDESPVVNKQLIEHQNEGKNNKINDRSTMIISNSLQVERPMDRDSDGNASFVLLTACSSVITRTSSTSDQGRSSSTTRTSIH